MIDLIISTVKCMIPAFCVNLENNSFAYVYRGELLLRGNNIVTSYFSDDVTNKESFDENKWFVNFCIFVSGS